MASLIPGFEYDIFISYRQKDTKGDRWVSVFVEASNDKFGLRVILSEERENVIASQRFLSCTSSRG